MIFSKKLLYQLYKVLPVSLRHHISYLLSDKFNVGIAAIITRNHKLLLVKHSYQYWWALPGGYLNHNEEFEYGITRELEEEIGVKISMGKILEIHPHPHHPMINIVIFATTKCANLIPNKTEVEIAQYFPMNQLPPQIIPDHLKYIEKYIKQI